jgi:hypothetical protein
MDLRRSRVVGCSFAAGAPPLTHVCAVGACGKNARRGPPVALPGVNVYRRAWGDGANRFSTARHAAFNDQIFAESLSESINLENLLWDKLVPVSHQSDRTNFVLAQETPCKGKMAVWRRPGVAQAEKPWGSIRRDGLSVRLGAHWEVGL